MQDKPESMKTRKEQLQVEEDIVPETERPVIRHRHRSFGIAGKASILLGVFVAGLVSGVLLSGPLGKVASTITGTQNMSAMLSQVNPPNGVVLPVSFGDVGPRMLAAGAIALDQFVQLYQQAGKPLTDEQLAILKKGSTARITINANNASFLLNFFWAVGLVNQNPVLTEGPMMANGQDQIGYFASTGGWTLGAKSPTELYASILLIPLTGEQQARLEQVASAVYRPCCDNPTHFPDCNHGMAMLGVLELMASQNASADEMFTAAKYVNAYWYPQQMLEIATFFKSAQKVNYPDADARQLVSSQYSSSSGFQEVHSYLERHGLLEQVPNSGGSCGVQ